MRIVFVINGVTEILAGLLFMLLPSKLPGVTEAGNVAINMAGIYGAAALAMGVLSLIVSGKLHNKELVSSFLIFGLIFHVGVTTFGILYPKPTLAFHALMVVCFLFFLMKSTKHKTA